MRRGILHAIGIAAVVVAAADLGARFVLGRDLIALAERPPAVASAPAPLPAPPPPLPLLMSAETSRYVVSWVVPPSCRPDASCVIQVTVQPTPGRFLPEGPFNFRQKASPGFVFAVRPEPIRAKERTRERAIVEVPLHVYGSGEHRLEGDLRVFTCSEREATCTHEQHAVSIPVT